MADAIHRDLTTDRLSFDDLGWRGLWAYVTKAPPLTAIHYDRSGGLSASDDIALAHLNETREINWRYTAMHFENGSKQPFPERITREKLLGEPELPEVPLTLDEIIPPHVRALLQGA